MSNMYFFLTLQSSNQVSYVLRPGPTAVITRTITITTQRERIPLIEWTCAYSAWSNSISNKKNIMRSPCVVIVIVFVITAVGTGLAVDPVHNDVTSSTLVRSMKSYHSLRVKHRTNMRTSFHFSFHRRRRPMQRVYTSTKIIIKIIKKTCLCSFLFGSFASKLPLIFNFFFLHFCQFLTLTCLQWLFWIYIYRNDLARNWMFCSRRGQEGRHQLETPPEHRHYFIVRHRDSVRDLRHLCKICS